MMNILEEAVIYATILHQGKVRKFKGVPYILHPLEVAHADPVYHDGRLGGHHGRDTARHH